MLNDCALILAAGGSSRRFGGGNKLLREVGGVPVFIHTLRRFYGLLPVVAVVPAEAREEFEQAAAGYPGVVWACGGATRGESVMNGLAALPHPVSLVAIHDAARPLADGALLEKLLERAREMGGAIPGKPVTDTVKRTQPDGLIVEEVSREGLWRVETPQVFDREKLLAAYRAAGERSFTDDAGVMAAAGFPVAVVSNPAENLKLTYDFEFERLAALL